MKKKKSKLKKVACGKTGKKAAAWEQVSCNDVVLTDVGQFSSSLPKSVPVGAQASAAHMLPPPERLNALDGYSISERLKSGPEVTALNASGGRNIVPNPTTSKDVKCLKKNNSNVYSFMIFFERRQKKTFNL